VGEATVADVIRDFRREQVVSAARRLFEQRGSIDVSMAEIADAAGISRSTVYNHFSTREDVLTACIHAGQELLVARVDSAVASAETPVERLVALLEACIAHVDESPGFFRIMTGLSSAPPAGSEAPSLELGMTSLRVGKQLRTVIADGVVAGVFDVEVEAAARLVGFVLVGLLEARAGDGPSEPNQVARETVELLVTGLGGRPPQSRRRPR
jgi:AcrR family transcriptional regulator